MPTVTGINIDRRQKLQKKFATIEFRAFDLCRVSNYIKTEALATFVQNYDLKDDRCQYWQVSNLISIKNHKKLLSLLNSPPSICVEYEISSKLKHLPFSVQNYGLKDDRCQNWQVSILTGIKNYKNLVSPLLVQSTKFGLKDDRCQHWQVSRITENYCHQWIQYLQIVHYAKFRGKWLTSFPAPRSPFPIPLFKDSRKNWRNENKRVFFTSIFKQHT